MTWKQNVQERCGKDSRYGVQKAAAPRAPFFAIVEKPEERVLKNIPIRVRVNCSGSSQAISDCHKQCVKNGTPLEPDDSVFCGIAVSYGDGYMYVDSYRWLCSGY